MDGNDHEFGFEPWRVWLRRVVGDHGGPVAVSRLADVPLQTLNNHLHNRTKKPNLDVLRRVSEACASPMLWLKEEQSRNGSAGSVESDVVTYVGGLPPIAATTTLGRWLVKSRALDLAGIVPGDFIEFTADADPQEGDPVVAQLNDEQGNVTTVLRLFYPPFLMVRTSDPTIDQRPIEIGANDRLMGAFVQLVRRRS